MIGVVQRVSRAEVRVKGNLVSRIERGVLLLVGIARGDSAEDAAYIVQKTANLRIFSDENGNMNRSLIDVNGSILVVSQFTLLGSTHKGRRPSFTQAAPPDYAEALYRQVLGEFRKLDITVKEGVFGAMMEVNLTNDGPVTLLLNSSEKNKKNQKIR
jgi:D-tyrosyl-tRNA(Tyr) deacylase